MERLDDIDIQILKELQRNAKLTVKELADKSASFSVSHLRASEAFWSVKAISKTMWLW